MTKLSRRPLLGALALGATGLGWSGPSAGETWRDAMVLKDHAARARMIFGSAIALENFALPEARALYAREAALVTTDLALKFAVLRPAQDVFNFEPADALVSWAKANGLLVRGHALIWNESNGDWIKRCSAWEIERIFDEHIERTVSRYAGRIDIWDVVNEPFWPDHGEPGGYRRGPWYNALGPGYIRRALKRVRGIDPAVKLCVNEAHVDSDNSWGRAIRPCFAQLVGELRAAGTPFDIAGVQCHLKPALPHDYGRFADYLTALATHRVEVHITEFDVDDQGFPDDIAERDRLVAEHASGFLKPVLAVPSVTMLVTWELADTWSFYWHMVHDRDPNASRLPRPLPFDGDLRRKPLWSALAAAFDARRSA